MNREKNMQIRGLTAPEEAQVLKLFPDANSSMMRVEEFESASEMMQANGKEVIGKGSTPNAQIYVEIPKKIENGEDQRIEAHSDGVTARRLARGEDADQEIPEDIFDRRK